MKTNSESKVFATRRFAARAAVLACAMTAFSWAATSHGLQLTPLGDVVSLDQGEVRADDLVRLATSLADAVREQKTADLSVKTLQSLQPNAAVTGLEMQIARINAQAAQQKVAIIRAIAESQLAVARTRLEFLRRIGDVQDGEAADAEVVASPQIKQAEATVRILEMILDIK